MIWPPLGNFFTQKKLGRTHEQLSHSSIRVISIRLVKTKSRKKHRFKSGNRASMSFRIRIISFRNFWLYPHHSWLFVLFCSCISLRKDVLISNVVQQICAFDTSTSPYHFPLRPKQIPVLWEDGLESRKIEAECLTREFFQSSGVFAPNLQIWHRLLTDR